jgi:hypothetical protein
VYDRPIERFVEQAIPVGAENLETPNYGAVVVHKRNKEPNTAVSRASSALQDIQVHNQNVTSWTP